MIRELTFGLLRLHWSARRVKHASAANVQALGLMVGARHRDSPEATNDLSRLSGERVPLPEGFQISERVLTAIAERPSILSIRGERTLHVCPDSDCRQVIGVAKTPRGEYHYTPDELRGLYLAHLIQRHGWTRETVGD